MINALLSISKQSGAAGALSLAKIFQFHHARIVIHAMIASIIAYLTEAKSRSSESQEPELFLDQKPMPLILLLFFLLGRRCSKKSKATSFQNGS